MTPDPDARSAPGSPASTSPASSRRELWIWVLGCAAGAVLILVAAGRTWVTVSFEGAQRVEVGGGDLAPAAQTLALAALAAIVAVLATAGVWRRLVGVVIALCGAGAVALAVAALDGSAAVEAALRRQPMAAADAAMAAPGPWAYLAVAGGALLVVAGLTAMVRGGRWAGMSARYERRAPTAKSAERSMWEALDRGDDPTDER